MKHLRNGTWKDTVHRILEIAYIIAVIILLIKLCSSLSLTAEAPESVVSEVSETFYYDVPLDHELQDYIFELCDYNGLPTELVMAIIRVESNFDVNAVSGTSDYGLMQINTINLPELEEKLGITDLLDPYQNVKSGIWILTKHYAKTFGDIEWTLVRYNNGATGAYRLHEQGIYSTTYSRKVLEYYEMYKEARSAILTN